MSTLILTRPEAAARRFARAVRARGIGGAILFSPMIRIEHLPIGDPGAATLILTSENGVSAVRSALRGRKVVVVGPRTAAAAHAAGASPEELGGDSDALADALIACGGGPYLHLHGRHVTGDLTGQLRAAGLSASARVVYDQHVMSLSSAARDALAGPAPTVLPLFSRRSARLVADALGAAPVETTVIAMSEAVAQGWPWPSMALVSRSAEARSMLDEVAAVVERARTD